MAAARQDLKRRLLSVEEGAYYLGISKRSLQTLLKDGEIPKVRIGNRTLLDQPDLDAYVERIKVESA